MAFTQYSLRIEKRAHLPVTGAIYNASQECNPLAEPMMLRHLVG